MVIALLFAAAWAIARLATRLAVVLVDRAERRRSRAEGDIAPDALAALKQRETAISLIQTSVRYLVFGLAALLSLITLTGAQRAETIVGASFLAILLGFAAQRFLTDLIAGLLIFFERWFRVGDMVVIPSASVEGVVEEVSLRSIRLRSLDGDVIRVANSQVQSARVVPRGFREVEVELFVTDAGAGRRLVERVAALVPASATHFVRRPRVAEVESLGEDLHRVRARAAVPPGREWLATELLPQLLKERGGEAIVHGPVVTPLDEQARRRFARAVVASERRRARAEEARGRG